MKKFLIKVNGEQYEVEVEEVLEGVEIASAVAASPAMQTQAPSSAVQTQVQANAQTPASTQAPEHAQAQEQKMPAVPEPESAKTPAAASTPAPKSQQQSAQSHSHDHSHGHSQPGSVVIKAPMPGTILKVSAKPGDEVKKGQIIMILEAMKMENEMLAPSNGRIATINVAAGTAVNAGDVLATLS